MLNIPQKYSSGGGTRVLGGSLEELEGLMAALPAPHGFPWGHHSFTVSTSGVKTSFSCKFSLDSNAREAWL